MTWSFTDSATPSTKDKVRLLIGDADTTNQKITDEKINYYLSENSSNLISTAIDCLQHMAATVADQVNFSNTGGISVSASERHKAYQDLIAQLKKIRGSNVAMKIYASETANIETLDEDSNATQPSFEVGMHGYDTQYQIDRDGGADNNR
jgi:hypothetical protein